jgi:tol-pal system protein YbgF
MKQFKWTSGLLVSSITVICLLVSFHARAGLFEDEDARKAILDLRQKIEELKTSEARALNESEKIKLNMLDQANALESLRAEIATLRGEKDALGKELSDTQRHLKDLNQALEARLAKLEPVKVNLDGREFTAEQSEKKEFEAALDLFKKGDFAPSSAALNDFLKRHPQSGYKVSALFWLGNAQYATREYKDAIANFKALLSIDPNGLRSAEAMLSISNCQLDMKDTKAAKKTWDDIIKTYPDTEAASAAKERLARFK